MLDRVSLLIPRFGLGYTASMVVMPLAVGLMVMINSVTKSWRTDGVKIARALPSCDLSGWAMGLEHAHNNPQAAVQALSDVIAQVDGSTLGVVEGVVTSDLIPKASDFNAAQARAEAAEELTAVDAAALRATMFNQST